MLQEAVQVFGGKIVRIGLFFLAALVTLSAASGQSTEELAAARAASTRILTATPEASATWEVLSDGALRHKPSGLVCSTYNVPNVPLAKILVTADSPPEHNAVCMYATEDGAKTAQLAATKVGEDTSVEKIQTAMRKVVLDQYKGAQSLGPVTFSLLGSSRAEAFATTENGQPCITILFVNVVKGWAVWMMATTPDPKQDAKSARLTGMLVSAAFQIGLGNVERTALGLPRRH